MKFSVVVSTHAASFQAATLQGDLGANLAAVSAVGYEGVELAIRDPRMVEVPPLELLLKSHRLEVPAIGTGQAWGEERLSFTDREPAVRRAALDRIISHIPLAARLGSLIIIGLIRGITPAGQSREDSLARFLEALHTVASAARVDGVRLAIEPLNRYETDLVRSVSEGLDLLEELGADNVGLLLDTFHMNIEEPSIEDSMARAGKHIFHFHVADSNRRYPGAGHLHFPRILGALQGLGYEGYVSGEFIPWPDAHTAAERSLPYLRWALGEGGRRTPAGSGATPAGMRVSRIPNASLAENGFAARLRE